MNPPRLIWLASAVAALLLLAVVATFSPIRLQITFDNQTTTANAGGLNLPTTTPAPPTAVPPTDVPATLVPATPVPPTPEPATPVPPTPEPPPDRQQKTPTPDVATPIPATPEPPPLPLMQPPQIRIIKRASLTEALPGDRFSYTLEVTNSGQGTARDVVISDDVPAMLKVVDLRSTKGDMVVNGQRVTAYPRTLAAGETQSYTIVVQIDANAAPGSIPNTAIITTTTIGDDTGDNTSTTTVIINTPLTKQTTPPRLPTTADPTVLDTTLLVYWPLVVLALTLVAFGVATRRGAFRQQTLAVTVGGLPIAADAFERHELAGFATQIQLDPHDLAQRWQAGAATRELVQLVAQQNPQADRLAISIAVQKVLQRSLHRTND